MTTTTTASSKYHKQLVCSSEHGDCFATCVANLLGVHPSQIPNFCGPGHQEDWWDYAQAWLNGIGCSITAVRTASAPDAITIAICATKSEHHAVLWCNGEMIHDPSPKDWPPGSLGVPDTFVLLTVSDAVLLAEKLAELIHRNTKATVYTKNCEVCTCFYVTEEKEDRKCRRCK